MPCCRSDVSGGKRCPSETTTSPACRAGSDTSQPDPAAAVEFYRGLFGWEFEDVMPPGSGASYFMGRLHGGDVAAVGSIPDGRTAMATWNTYIAVADADETAAEGRATPAAPS